MSENLNNKKDNFERKVIINNRPDEKRNEETKKTQALALRPINISITPKAVELAFKQSKKDKVLKISKKTIAISIAAALTLGTIAGIASHKDKPIDKPIQIETQVDMVPPKIVKGLDADRCYYADTGYIVRNATKNVKGMGDTIQLELDALGADCVAVGASEDELGDAVKSYRIENPDRRIVIIDLNGQINKDPNQNIIITKNSDGGKSSDALALAVKTSMDFDYEIDVDSIRSGVVDPKTGKRGTSKLEDMIIKNHELDNISFITIAPSIGVLNGDTTTKNSLATAIVEGVSRYSTLSSEEKDEEYLHRVWKNETIDSVGKRYGITPSFISSSRYNDGKVSVTGDLLEDSTILVRQLPEELTDAYTVLNPVITTNKDEVNYVTYEVKIQKNDTISELAEKCGVSISDFYVPSGDPNVIKVGETVTYSRADNFPVLVSKPEMNYQIESPISK